MVGPVVVAAPADHSVTLSWTVPNPQNLAGFEVWRSNDGRDFDLITPTLLAPTTAQFTDAWSGLATGTSFIYEVRAGQRGDQPTNANASTQQPNFSAPITVVVSGATVIAIPSPSNTAAGKKVVQ